jgi:hypothetical protein
MSASKSANLVLLYYFCIKNVAPFPVNFILEMKNAASDAQTASTVPKTEDTDEDDDTDAVFRVDRSNGRVGGMEQVSVTIYMSPSAEGVFHASLSVCSPN